MAPPKKIKTKLPAVRLYNKARIKRIMRTDEDVGKVSQATPILIAKALESFLEALVQKTLVETNSKQAKKMTIAHVYLSLIRKQAVMNEPKFDFLLSLVKELPDPTNEEEKPKRKRKSKKDAELEKEEDEDVVKEEL